MACPKMRYCTVGFPELLQVPVAVRTSRRRVIHVCRNPVCNEKRFQFGRRSHLSPHDAFQLKCCKRLLVPHACYMPSLTILLTPKEPSRNLNNFSKHAVSAYPRTIPYIQFDSRNSKFVPSLEQFAIREMKIYVAVLYE
jgi:hypothetical protein